jgi:hypothetical protein
MDKLYLIAYSSVSLVLIIFININLPLAIYVSTGATEVIERTNNFSRYFIEFRKNIIDQYRKDV